MLVVMCPLFVNWWIWTLPYQRGLQWHFGLISRKNSFILWSHVNLWYSVCRSRAKICVYSFTDASSHYLLLTLLCKYQVFILVLRYQVRYQTNSIILFLSITIIYDGSDVSIIFKLRNLDITISKVPTTTFWIDLTQKFIYFMITC